jgi:hypothetical protein
VHRVVSLSELGRRHLIHERAGKSWLLTTRRFLRSFNSRFTDLAGMNPSVYHATYAAQGTRMIPG